LAENTLQKALLPVHLSLADSKPDAGENHRKSEIPRLLVSNQRYSPISVYGRKHFIPQRGQTTCLNPKSYKLTRKLPGNLEI
jgi:hypothetical protein